MATDFIMPRMGDAARNNLPYGAQQPPTRQHPFPPPASAFQPQPPQPQQRTPEISPLSTSTSSSPQSPKSFHARQLRPLYMPAVLRPTEFHSKPPTPPRAKPDDDADDDAKPRSSGSFISLPGLGKINISHLRRRSTGGDSAKSLSGSLKLDEFPQVNGLPSRSHWKPDSSSTICDEPTCHKYFSYFTRRHHCRRCGNIFCDAHSSFEVPLDEHANYNPRAEPSRSCSHCFHEFKLWRSRTSSKASSTSDDAASSQATPHAATAPASPIASASSSIASPHGVPTAATSATNSNKADIAQSVPRDWHWSTF